MLIANNASSSGRLPAGMTYGGSVRPCELVFQQAEVRVSAAGGPPKTKLVDIGMPAVPKRFLDCVVYLYPSVASAEVGQCAGGSGFIASVKSKTHPEAVHMYMVSNYHTVMTKGCTVARVNRRDGGVSIIDHDQLDWVHIPDGGDVAAAPFTAIEGVPWLHVSEDVLLTQAQCGDMFGVGDDVFMVGRFIDHDGGETNRPALRFGNVSIEPTPMAARNSNSSVEYFCLDMHSRSGFSGSPVFVYRTPGSDLSNVFTDDGTRREPVVLTSRDTKVKLLGIHCGQFPENMWLKGDKEDDPGTRPIVGYSGMTYALPAWKILELLHCPKFVASRALRDAEFEGVNFPCQE